LRDWIAEAAHFGKLVLPIGTDAFGERRCSPRRRRVAWSYKGILLRPFSFPRDNYSTSGRLLCVRLLLGLRTCSWQGRKRQRLAVAAVAALSSTKARTEASGVLAMTRFLSIVAGLLLFASPVAAADAKTTKIIWHGQSFFEIISKDGTRIVLDPHAIEAFGRNIVIADVILCSHNHTDHTQLSAIEPSNLKMLQEKKLVFIGTKGDDKKQEWVKIDGKVKDATFTNVPTYHDDDQGMRRGKNSILIIEVDGLRIVHLGDLGHTLTDAQLEKVGVGKVDVLMIPIGGVYTLNGLRAQEVIKQIKPKRYIIPMHYGVKGYDDLLDIDKSKFLELDDPDLKVTVKRFAATNELEVDSGDKVPTTPIIAVLHWEKKTGDK
jgi:L-ascorbate metabolism protein UlaG (beta-lactamase superfamily)